MTIAEIVTKVRAIMNEVGEDESLNLLNEDRVKLDDYIKSAIPDAVNLVLESCSINSTTPSLSLSSITTSEGISSIKLPDDFLRFAAIKMEEWKRAVHHVYPSTSDKYKQEHNDITRSGNNKPSACYAYDSSGKVIECYPSGTLEYFLYVKSFSPSAGDTELSSLNPVLFPSICYMTAYLVYNYFEIPNTGNQMKTIAVELMPKDAENVSS